MLTPIITYINPSKIKLKFYAINFLLKIPWRKFFAFLLLNRNIYHGRTCSLEERGWLWDPPNSQI